MPTYGVFRRHKGDATTAYVIKRENVDSDKPLAEFPVNEVYPDAEQRARAHFYCNYVNMVEQARDAAGGKASVQWLVQMALAPVKP